MCERLGGCREVGGVGSRDSVDTGYIGQHGGIQLVALGVI